MTGVAIEPCETFETTNMKTTLYSTSKLI